MDKLSKVEIKNLINKAYRARKNVVKMMKGGEAHVGGALSCLDILTILFSNILRHDPKRPKWENRDRFILSAGHKAEALYAILQEQGYFEEEVLHNRFVLNSKIPVHPDEKMLPGVEYPTGSLGHGLSAGSGIAIIAKLDKKDYRIFVLLGDGECAEGTVWEAALASAHYKLDNLIAIVDRNGLQVNGRTSDIMNTSPLEDKFRSFGWEAKVINGHNYNEIYEGLITAPYKTNKPSCIIADTVKSKGISFIENDFLSHHCNWNDEEINTALFDIENNFKKELEKIG